MLETIPSGLGHALRGIRAGFEKIVSLNLNLDLGRGAQPAWGGRIGGVLLDRDASQGQAHWRLGPLRAHSCRICLR